jgi:hypothetical protein
VARDGEDERALVPLDVRSRTQHAVDSGAVGESPTQGSSMSRGGETSERWCRWTFDREREHAVDSGAVSEPNQAFTKRCFVADEDGSRAT